MKRVTISIINDDGSRIVFEDPQAIYTLPPEAIDVPGEEVAPAIEQGGAEVIPFPGRAA